MKSDLDAIMEANQVDALIVVGSAAHNPAMVYLTGGAHLTGAALIKKRGERGVIFHGPMERDEALKSGLETISYSKYPLAALIKEAGGDRLKAEAQRWKKMLTDVGLTSGRVVLYGKVDLETYFPVFQRLQKIFPGLELVGDIDGSIMQRAMFTKDANEIEHIRRMGKVTTEVVGKVAEFLQSHAAKDGVLVKEDGSPLRIGEVKNLINLWLAERGAENPEGTIFAIGRDAGVPHSSGNPEDELRLGQPIVFDIYPCEAGGGYFYDFTRTWCLGYAPAEVQKLYDQVYEVYRAVTDELDLNAPLKQYQLRTCELYEKMGHPTPLSKPDTEEGYVHSLSHGLGLRVHERPFSGPAAPSDDIAAAGVVFTVEPGLYYPERGMGARIEDTWYVRPDGTMEIVAPYPYDLVLPVKSI